MHVAIIFILWVFNSVLILFLQAALMKYWQSELTSNQQSTYNLFWGFKVVRVTRYTTVWNDALNVSSKTLNLSSKTRHKFMVLALKIVSISTLGLYSNYHMKVMLVWIFQHLQTTKLESEKGKYLWFWFFSTKCTALCVNITLKMMQYNFMSYLHYPYAMDIRRE